MAGERRIAALLACACACACARRTSAGEAEAPGEAEAAEAARPMRVMPAEALPGEVAEAPRPTRGPPEPATEAIDGPAPARAKAKVEEDPGDPTRLPPDGVGGSIVVINGSDAAVTFEARVNGAWVATHALAPRANAVIEGATALRVRTGGVVHRYPVGEGEARYVVGFDEAQGAWDFWRLVVR